MADAPWPKFPVCLATDGGCVLAEVSRVLGDRWPMCLGRSFPCAWWPMTEVSRVLGDQWPMCLDRSFPCAWSLRPMADVSWPTFPVCLVTDGGCVLAETSRVLGDRWPMCLGRSFPCAWWPMTKVSRAWLAPLVARSACGSLRSWLAPLVARSARGSLRSWLAALVPLVRCARARGSLRPIPDVRPDVRPVPLLKGHLTQVLNAGSTWIRLRTSTVCTEGPFSAAPCHVRRAREIRPPTMDAPRSAARRLPMGGCSPRQVECFSPPVGPRWPWCLPRPSGVHRSLHRLRPPSAPPPRTPPPPAPPAPAPSKSCQKGHEKDCPVKTKHSKAEVLWVAGVMQLNNPGVTVSVDLCRHQCPGQRRQLQPL